MSKKVLMIMSSAHKNGNSDLLAEEFRKGAESAGNEVEQVFLRNQKIGYCLGCGFCQSHGGECVLKDDMPEINQKMVDADVIVLAGPVYYYSVNGQMKTLIDRTYARFMEMENKKLYYILSCADPSHASVDGAVAAFHGFAICLPNAEEAGTVYGVECMEHGEVKDKPSMKEAYDMGAAV